MHENVQITAHTSQAARFICHLVAFSYCSLSVIALLCSGTPHQHFLKLLFLSQWSKGGQTSQETKLKFVLFHGPIGLIPNQFNRRLTVRGINVRVARCVACVTSQYAP